MIRTLALGAFLTIGFAQAAPVPRELKAKPDAERILGMWVYDSYDSGNGQNGNSGRWYFEQDQMYSGGANTTDQKGTEYHIALRPDTHPRQIEISNREGGIVCSGIYEFTGEKLTIAYFRGGAKRPRDYTTANGKTIIVFQRGPETK